MTDRELRKLNRKDLLELLISQGRERDSLAAELEKTKAALQERQLCVEQAGSIAEAALQLNGVFDAAQAAAQQYLENIRLRSEQIEKTCTKREALCFEHEEETRQKIERQLQETEEATRKMIEEADKKCKAMEEDAKEKAQAYWAETSKRLEKFCQDHEELRELLVVGERP